MPRKRIRSKKKATPSLTVNQTLHLLLGWCFNTLEGRDLQFPFKDEEHRRTYWETHRGFLLDKDIDGSGELVQREPGTRPAAWWDYESPEPRKIIKNAEFWEPIVPDFIKKSGESPYSFGRLRFMHPVEGWSEAGYPLPLVESEPDYLNRLRLLLPGEMEAINKQKRGDHDGR